MPNRPPKPCTRCGKPAEPGQSQCSKHLAQMRARGDAKRGTSYDRGYDDQHESEFRAGVFALFGTACVAEIEPGQRCNRYATHADHYPHSRRELVAMGHNPNDPTHGRPLCVYHHNQHTGKTQGRLAKGKR